MNSIKIEQDELAIMAIYKAESPNASIVKIEEALPYVDDPDMSMLMNMAKEKLSKLTEDEYKQLNLNLYVFEGED